MNKRSTLLVGATLLLSTMMVTTAAHSGGRGGPSGDFSERGVAKRIERMADQLDLSDSQLTQIQTIAQDARNSSQAVSLIAATQANRDALQAASSFDQYDAATVAELANQQGALVAQRIALRAQTKQDVLAVLTAEQRAELEVLKEERKARRAERRALRAERRANRRGG